MFPVSLHNACMHAQLCPTPQEKRFFVCVCSFFVCSFYLFYFILFERKIEFIRVGDAFIFIFLGFRQFNGLSIVCSSKGLLFLFFCFSFFLKFFNVKIFNSYMHSQKSNSRDFSDGPVIKRLSIPMKGCRINPWSGNATCLEAKNPKHKTDVTESINTLKNDLHH